MRQALTLTALSVACLVVIAGCERPEDPMLKILESTATQTRVDDLARTIDYVYSERQYDQTEFNNGVSNGLNRWTGYSKDLFDKSGWKPDPLIADMIKEYEGLPVVDRMSGGSFLASDPQDMQSLIWMDKIVDSVTNDYHLGQFELYRLMADDYQPDENEEFPFDVVTQKLNPDLDEKNSRQLSLAIRLFDWVTRNVQLDETPSYTDEEVEEKRLVEADTLEAMGLPGVGSKRSAWQLLMFGRGDYVEKAKLFMMLCHRVDMPAVLFATGKDANPWAVGVLIGDDFYLFDTRLGLPIPGKDYQSVATLADVQADASLLSRLNLTVKESLADDTNYWVTESDLENMTGLVYWNPRSASERMAVLEGSIIGDQSTTLVQRADETIAKLPKVEGVAYKPWDVSLRTAMFRQVLSESMPKAVTDDALAEKLRWYFPEEGYVMLFTNYRTSRVRFLHGKFERSKESRLRDRDAIESFAMLMYEDETIAGLGSDRDLQNLIGIQRAGRTPADLEREINARQAQMRLVRRDAGLFMCQSHFDNGSLSTTANWVPKLLEEQDVDRWKTALSYLYARSLESRHQYDEAIEELKSDSTQQHGNLIRARMLKQQIETRFAKKSDEEPDAQ